MGVKKADNPNAFKHQVNEETAKKLARALRQAWPEFNSRRFLARVRAELPPLELKQRIALLAEAMADCLPQGYPDALAIVLVSIGPELKAGEPVASAAFYHWVHAHFVQTRGLDHFEESLQALSEITKRGTSEFAVRPFLLKDTARALRYLRQQVSSKNEHVRRWVSEGTRARLPWGQRLPMFQADPSPTLELLEQLKNDSSLYVRTSVANHLGDIAKDHPELAVATVKRWLDEGNAYGEWIAKKALRHLIKSGHAGALAALGVSKNTRVSLARLRLDKKTVAVGEKLGISFSLAGKANEQLVVDYAIEYQLAGKKTGRKVYKLKTARIGAGDTLTFTKHHSFRPITTRTYYPGSHQIEVLVNGNVLGKASFKLAVVPATPLGSTRRH